jgi:hypothetical protein
VNEILKALIGSLLILTPGFALIQEDLERSGKRSLRERVPSWVAPSNGGCFVVFIGGCLVGMTSIGTGSTIMVLLVLFYNRSLLWLERIAHAVILATIAGAGHLVLSTFRFPLLATLLLGSIPRGLVCCQSGHFSANNLAANGSIFTLAAAGIAIF